MVQCMPKIRSSPEHEKHLHFKLLMLQLNFYFEYKGLILQTTLFI